MVLKFSTNHNSSNCLNSQASLLTNQTHFWALSMDLAKSRTLQA